MECKRCASCGSCRRCNTVIENDIVTSQSSNGGIPLVMASDGESGIIVRITGNQDTKRYMSDLGFTTGSKVSIVKKVSKDLIVEVKGSRIAMDSTVASRLYFLPM